MPAPKRIPIPEVRAFRLDERILDSRTTKGWMSDDERLIATHTGGVLFDIDLNCAKWDEKTGEMILKIHPQDAKRILRWIRHATEHVGIFLHRLEELD